MMGQTLGEMAENENGRLAGTDWTFSWTKNRLYGPGGPRHWGRWKCPGKYTVGEVDAGKYMATGPNHEPLKDEDGFSLEWAHAADALAHIDKLRGLRTS